MKHTALTFLLLAACGGSGVGHSKLRSRVNDAHLAPVSPAQRSSEAEALREVFLAEWQIAYTESQIEATQLELKIAKNELESAKIGAKTAEIKHDAAEAGADMNEVKGTEQEQKVASMGMDVHKLEMERAKQALSYLEKRLEYERRQHRYFEAKLELAKADNLKNNQIQPPNFNYSTYKAQLKERADVAKTSREAMQTEANALKAIDAKLGKASKELEGAAAMLPVDEPPPTVPANVELPPETTPMRPPESEGTGPGISEDNSQNPDAAPPGNAPATKPAPATKSPPTTPAPKPDNSESTEETP